MSRAGFLVLASALVLFVVAVSPAVALTVEEAEHFLLDIYNPNVENIIPDLPLVKDVFGGQVIHIIIKKEGGDIEFGATTDSNGYITDLKRGAPSNPTMRLKSDEETVDKIVNSDDPVKETKEALLAGKITYEGVTLVNQIKVAIIKLVQWFAQLFGLI